MPRTREFDLHEALDRAMTVFWSKGYEATSIQNLVDHMGVQRGSLYAAFGDKHNLFVEALRHYGETVITYHLRLLEDPSRGLSAIRAFFDELVNCALEDSDAKGCFVTNTTAELAACDAVVASELRGSIEAMEARFFAVLQAARAQGELAADKDPRTIAQFLVASFHGLQITSKIQRQREHLETVKGTILAVLD
jgi:TetR/AcrR family transcriptional repressor of nem operon